jgi:simple sugar transport system permease protein
MRDLALVPAIAVIMVIGWIVSPVFLHWDNLVNVLQQQSEISLLVLAEALVLISGRMDLSLESTFGLAPGIAAWLVLAPGVAHGLGWLSGAWAIPVTLGVGLVIGVLNALLVVKFRINGFILTLGMLITLRGLLTGITGGKTFFNLPPSMMYLGNAAWLGLPASVWISLILFAAAGVVCGYTRFGRALYAVGGNADAAKAAGIRVDRALIVTFIVAGLLAALGGMLMSGRLASVTANQGYGMIFSVFAAAVIGGISLKGGRGTIFGALTGVLLLYLILNVIQLAGIAPQWNNFFNGAIILAALIITRVISGPEEE